VWEQLDQETSREGLDIILRLKGFYIKCGQMCASNIGNAFPVVWQETMSILQDQVPPEDFNSVILPIIQSELPNYQQIFTYIDPIPIGSASIGQVHRAKMIIHPNMEEGSHVMKPDTSDTPRTKDVVIKICYPHVERLLRGDVRTIRTFCEIAQPVHVPAMREVEKQFVTEFDYVQEANNLYEVRTNLIRAHLCQANADDDSHSTAICTVPFPYRQYCTKRVLVMEEIHGDKLVDVLKRDGQRWMEWASKMESMPRSTSTSNITTDKNAISNDHIESPPISEKRITTEEFQRYLSLMDTSRRIHNIWNRLYNSTIGLIKGTQIPYQYASELPLNPSKLVDDLMYIHGHQVLVDGRFNADCHPGMLVVFCSRNEVYCMVCLSCAQLFFD
jgi:aarF domain-containing kinase